MAKLDTKQLERNRRSTSESLFETPWNTQFDDSGDDIAQQIYDHVPDDKVGFLPPTEEE